MIGTFKKILYFLVFYSGLIFIFRWIYGKFFNNPIKISFSHRIIDSTDELYPFLRELGYFTVDEFERKLLYLLKHYNLVSLQQGLKYLSQKKRPANCVVLTFDDGYRCIFERAFPVLKKYNIPATVFLTAGLIENDVISWHNRLINYIGKTKETTLYFPEISKERFNLTSIKEKAAVFLKINRYLKMINDELIDGIMEKIRKLLRIEESVSTERLMLSWGEIREMADSGLITFGAHTMFHPILNKVPLQRAEFEIKQSKLFIEGKLGVPVEFFAYPNGDFNSSIEDLVKKCGYSVALTTNPGGNTNNEDLFALKREGFTRESFFLFGLNVAGFFELIKMRPILKYLKLIKIQKNDHDKGLKYWLHSYILQQATGKRKPDLTKPTHIMLCIVDHFEPFHGGVSFDTAKRRILSWIENYPKFADKYSDADGKKPRHTWFYPPHHDLCFLKDLVKLCEQGYGEIEMHLHHNHIEPFPDTSETLRVKIMRCVEDYSKYGIFCLPDGTKKFAFIHGDWSLNNSRGVGFCGVNDEIRVLKECGCYGDFTFPSLGKAQPAMINRIYYAKADSLRPKSYNWGKELVVGGKSWGDLLIVTGIIGLRWINRNHRFFPTIEVSSLDQNDKPNPRRIDYWINNGITVKGRPDWKFIKLHIHGAGEESNDSVFGKAGEEMHRYLHENYNDGKRFVLHYASAREMVNIIKAAEAGKKDNPGKYRNFIIPEYIYLNPTKTNFKEKKSYE